jgi:aerotaxis receptor
VVKNRRKNGDHYWVLANVTPIMRDGKPQGYMSVRIKPSRAQIQNAEDLYRTMCAASSADALPFYLEGGELRYKGLRGLAGRAQRLTLTRKLFVALGLMSGLGMLPSC